MAAELSNDVLSSCMDKTYKKFYEELNSHSNLTAVNRKIRLGRGQKKNIEDFT